MKIAICDDNTEYLSFLTEQVKTYIAENDPSISVNTFPPDSLMIQLENNRFDYNIILLDIKMGSYDGIYIAKLINDTAPLCNIIFVTNYLDLATEVYDVSHTYFILKSELKKRLPVALNRAVRKVCDDSSKYVIIKNNSRNICLDSKDITYAEVYGKKLTIHLSDGEKYIANQALKKLQEQLDDFIRIHNSFLVNPSYIRSLTKDLCHLSEGISLPVSRTYSKKAMDAYNRYLASIL